MKAAALAFALGATAAGADMERFISPGERSALTVVAEDGGATIGIPNRRVWLHILPCAVMAALSAWLLVLCLSDLVSLRLSLVGGVALLLSGAFTAGSGVALLWLSAGRQVVRVRLGSFETGKEVLGFRLGKPERRTGPILAALVEAHLHRSEVSYGGKLVRVRFVSGDEAWISGYLDGPEARRIADAIRAHDRGPEAKEVSKELFQETYFKHGGARDYWEQDLSLGKNNRFFIAQPATPEHRLMFVARDGDAIRLCFVVKE